MIPAKMFDGGHGREGTIQIVPASEDWPCDVCGKWLADGLVPLRVLVIDSSEGEYRPGGVCLPCIETMFAESAT